jgi:hypothetical protein
MTPEEQAAAAAKASAEAAATLPATAERQRAADITDICTRASVPAEKVSKFIADGTAVEEVRKQVFDEMVQRDQDAGGSQRNVTRVYTVNDETKTRLAGMEEAFLHRVNPKSELTDNGRQYRGMTLLEMGREHLERSGVNTRGMTRMQLAGRCCSIVRAACSPPATSPTCWPTSPTSACARRTKRTTPATSAGPAARRTLRTSRHERREPGRRAGPAAGQRARRVQVRRHDRRQGNVLDDHLRAHRVAHPPGDHQRRPARLRPPGGRLRQFRGPPGEPHGVQHPDRQRGPGRHHRAVPRQPRQPGGRGRRDQRRAR